MAERRPGDDDVDIVTGLMIWSAEAMTLGILLLSRWFQSRESIYLSWGAGFILHGLGVILVCLRTSVPDFVSIEVANTMALAGMGCWVGGILQFDGRRLDAYIAIPALVWVAGMFLAPIRDDFAHRAALHAFASTLAYAMMIAHLYRRADRPLSARRVLTWLMVIPLVANAVLIVLCLSSHPASFNDASTARWLFVPIAFCFVAGIMSGAKMLTDRTEDRLKLLALTDPLTNALNRRGLIDGFDALCQVDMPAKPLIALLHFDLDHFKQINDLHGHQAGDAVLVAFARIGAMSLRGRGRFGRMGGEEFASIMRVADVVEAASVAEAIRTTLKQQTIRAGAADVIVTVSAGISMAGASAANLDTLLTASDRALYAAKESGRDRTAVTAANGITIVPAEDRLEDPVERDTTLQVNALRKMAALGEQ